MASLPNLEIIDTGMVTMTENGISINYGPTEFDTSNSKVYGRMSANAGMLKALMLYSKRHSVSAYVQEQSDFNALQQQISRYQTKTKSIQPIFQGDIVSLQQSQLYFQNDPIISRMAWARQFISPSAFSLCGLIHSLSGMTLSEEMGRFILAPLQPWDALICTSTAGKQVIETMLQQWIDYLSTQHQHRFKMNLQLPVIPLGIHPEEVTRSDQAAELRTTFRKKWNINANDFVVLFVGRLFFYEKAHPIPMFLALEEVAKKIGANGKIHFVQAGWFENAEDASAFKAAAKTFCPRVQHILLTTLADAMKCQVLSAADVFISLADNIQETFGLTPLEAMANKLPVIVSDWNGYKDTVRHGIDGFRITTIMPPAGCGVDIALGFLTGAVNYFSYCGLNAQKTAVDIGECVEALWQLYQYPELRQRMGEAGYQRVLERYHWKQIMQEYDALWDEQTKMRVSANADAKTSVHLPPLIADPYATFAGYPSLVLSAQHTLSLGTTSERDLAVLQKNVMGQYGWQQRLSGDHLEKIIALVRAHSLRTVQQIVEHMLRLDAGINSGVVVRSLVYLIKYDFLRLEPWLGC